MSLKIVGVKIPFNGFLLEGGIVIEDGKIKRLGKEPSLPKSEETLRADGLLALPGLIDVHTHLRDMELSYEGDLYTETCAAVAGGFTTCLDMPNTRPMITNKERLDEKIKTAMGKIVANVGFWLTPQSIEEMEKTANDAIAYKMFMTKYLSFADQDFLPTDDETITKVLQKSEELGKVVAFHAEEGAMITERERAIGNFAMIKDYLHAHDVDVEVEAVKRLINLARKSKALMYIAHVSTASALNLLQEASLFEGLNIKWEAAPYHIFLSKEVLSTLGWQATLNPPLRSSLDSAILFEAVREGGVHVIGSDHAPHPISEKKIENQWKCTTGTPGLETTLPLLLTRVKKGELTLSRILELLAKNPAKIFGLDGKGELREGMDADITLVDMGQEHMIDPEKFHNKWRYSPFIGQKVWGEVVKTFVDGRLVYDGGEVIAKRGTGKIIKPIIKGKDMTYS